jgi:hypothetical protein
MILRRVGLICSLLIAELTLPLLSSAPTSASSALRECSYGQLEVGIASGPGGAAGTESSQFLIANTGKQTCTLKGYPTLSFYASRDRRIRTTVKHVRTQIYAEPKPLLVAIGRDGVASFGLSYTDGYPVAKHAVACKVVFVLVSLPTINVEHQRFEASLGFNMCQSNHEVSTTPIEAGPEPSFN